jgi:hypothetical protein
MVQNIDKSNSNVKTKPTQSAADTSNKDQKQTAKKGKGDSYRADPSGLPKLR